MNQIIEWPVSHAVWDVYGHVAAEPVFGRRDADQFYIVNI
jgi:hypothetical protein